MKLFLFALFIPALVGCSAEKPLTKEERQTWQYDDWKNKFKDRVFCKCLLVGYGKKELTDSIKQIDKSYMDAIGIAVFDKTIDSVLQLEAVKMSKDSLLSLNTVSEAAAGKKVFAYCLRFYKSKELLALTELESKKWRKISNIDSVVTQAIPSF